MPATSAKPTCSKIKLQPFQFQTDVWPHILRRCKRWPVCGICSAMTQRLLVLDVTGDRTDVLAQIEKGRSSGSGIARTSRFASCRLGVTAAQSQILLDKANAKVDMNGTYDFTHPGDENSASIFGDFDLPTLISIRAKSRVPDTRLPGPRMATFAQRYRTDRCRQRLRSRQKQRRNRAAVRFWIFKASQDSRDISQYAYKAARRACWISGCRTQLSFCAVGLSPGPGFVYDRP